MTDEWAGRTAEAPIRANDGAEGAPVEVAAAPAGELARSGVAPTSEIATAARPWRRCLEEA
jgi:hypothetical protein